MGRHLRLLEHLGIPSQGLHKEMPVFDADRRVLAAHLDDAICEPSYIVIHPGASVPERRWPPERFAAVADHLARQGLRIVLTGGANEELVTSAVQGLMRAPAINLTGHTNLGTLAALLESAALLVSNDTGVMHVGESVGTPLVAVSFDPEAWRWVPARC